MAAHAISSDEDDAFFDAKDRTSSLRSQRLVGDVIDCCWAWLPVSQLYCSSQAKQFFDYVSEPIDGGPQDFSVVFIEESIFPSWLYLWLHKNIGLMPS